jgi:hypothetical protein
MLGDKQKDQQGNKPSAATRNGIPKTETDKEMAI